MKHPLPLTVSAALLLHVSPAFAGTPVSSDKSPVPVSSRSGGWRFSAGFMHRSSGDFDWNAGTMSAPSLLTIGPGSNTPGIDLIGPADAFADRTYFDGFVRQDAGTPNGGDTWNWGYDNASQVAGDTISFTGGNGTSASFTESHDYDPGGWSGDLDGNAPFVEMAWVQPWKDSWNIGFQTSFSFLSTDTGRMLSTFTGSRGREDFNITYIDVYQLGGVIPPEAPYAGGPQGPGPLLPNVPGSRTPISTAAGGETVTAFNSIATDFDLNLSTLSFGPLLEYAHGPWAFTGSTGLTLNFANWDVEQNETLFVSRNGGAATAQNTWRHHDDHTEVLPGFFIQAAASREITENWSLQLIGRYDWVDDFNVSAGPSAGSVDVSGWSLGAGVVCRF